MSTPVSAVESPVWYRVGVADVVMLLLTFGIGQNVSKGMVNDPGLGWHLRTPELILQTGGWPTADPFLGPGNGNYWLANQWLGDIPLWLGWKAVGINGVIAVSMAVLLLVYRMLYRYLRADGVPWPAAALWTITAALGSYFVWMARPNLVTFFGVTLVTRLLTLYHEGRLQPRQLLWLLPLFTIWTNCHGGFIIGLLMIGMAVGLEGLLTIADPEADGKAAARKRLGVTLALGVGCALATLVNPYHFRVYPWIFSLLGDDYFMNLNQEWLSPDFHQPGTMRFGLFMLLFPLIFAFSKHRPNLLLLGYSLIWFYLSLKSIRYVPMWILVVTPLLARAAIEIEPLNKYLARFEVGSTIQLRSSGWLGYLLMLAGLGIWSVTSRPVEPNPMLYPLNGLQSLLASWKPGEVVMNNPNFGGYLTWHRWPELKVWIDDRNEVNGQAAYVAYFDLEETRAGWEANLAKANPDWIVLPPDKPLTYRLAERPNEWQETFRDGLVVVFHKRNRPSE